MPESSDPQRRAVAVVGAGAAGLMAALWAARSGAEVTLLEGTKDGGRKILISGGGRCNVLPSVAMPRRFVTSSSHNTLKKMLRAWPLTEQRAFFEEDLGIPLALEEESGKLFPESNKARDVRDALVEAARSAGVRLWFGTRVRDLERSADGWSVACEGAPSLDTHAVVLASGGLSVPATGSDGAGLAMARSLGLEVHATYPALTPLTAQPSPHAEMAGVSLEVTIRAPGAKPRFETTGGFLFTHRGWSGPAVLDASHVAVRGRPDGARQELEVQWSPRTSAQWEDDLRTGTGSVRALLTGALPRRLAERLMTECGLDTEARLAQLPRQSRVALVDALTRYRLPWTGDEGYKKAEVTGGGVALSEVHPRTMECAKAPGLFLCGEILDAFGPIGGHNFLWAWATGRAAGMGAAQAESA